MADSSFSTTYLETSSRLRRSTVLRSCLSDAARTESFGTDSFVFFDLFCFFFFENAIDLIKKLCVSLIRFFVPR